ncbi:MAG: hypothetical protein MI922_24620 [Bacteroidales bacterium]|nr:hypothetical protein [Bacteroidales bacterium]
MFDSKQYDWSNIDIVMLGRPVTGIRGVKYKTSQEKELIYARGNKPVSIGHGNVSYEGELTLLQSELEALQEAAGAGNKITDIAAFDVTVAYIPKGGSTVVTDIIKNVEFTEYEKGMAQGDKFMEVTMPFVALDIDYNV